MALMGKRSNSLASRMVKAAKAEKGMSDVVPGPLQFKEPDHPDEMTVRKAENGGFIVKPSGGKVSNYNAKDHVYADLAGVMECMESHFGGKKKDKSGDV